MVAAIAAVIVGIVFGLGQAMHSTFDKTKQCIELQGDAGDFPCDSGTGGGGTGG